MERIDKITGDCENGEQEPPGATYARKRVGLFAAICSAIATYIMKEGEGDGTIAPSDSQKKEKVERELPTIAAKQIRKVGDDGIGTMKIEDICELLADNLEEIFEMEKRK